MRDIDQRALDILSDLGHRPAAPFFEDGPAQLLMGWLKAIEGVETERDAFGNIIGHYSNSPSRRDGQPIAFVAHMDHPGFEIVEPTVEADVFKARALGGVPVASMTRPTPVLLLTTDGRRVQAKTVPSDGPPEPSGTERFVEIRVEGREQVSLPAPVVFDLPDFVLDGETIRMRALDDLAGCASVLAALERVVLDGGPADVFAVFTRAEEGGLFGARLMAEAGTLPQETIIVSVESSPVIPGVAQGEGPVIRTGDALTSFDNRAESFLVAARERIRKRDSGFKSQRQLMSGGICEGTAFAASGYSVTGLAFPLGNYHNATTRIPDPEGGVDAEYIRLSDFLGGVELIAEAAKGRASNDDLPSRRRLGPVPAEVGRRLTPRPPRFNTCV